MHELLAVMGAMNDLAAAIARHGTAGDPITVIPGVYILRSAAGAAGDIDLAQPLLCVLAQGRKRIVLGDTAYEYDPEHYMIVSAAVPVTGHVLEEPYLGLVVQIDRAELAALIAALPPQSSGQELAPGLEVHRLDGRLSDALCRLVALAERPADIAVLAPLLKREILFYLLLGTGGAALRQLASSTSRLAQIASAIDVIRRGYAEPLRVSELARAAHMSVPTFYRAFGAVTRMSPLQYQKQLRLQEARRLLQIEATDIAGIGAAVGYESPSQFSREYRRFFGAPPSRAHHEQTALVRSA